MEVGNFEYTPVSPRPRVRSGADPEAIEAADRADRQAPSGPTSMSAPACCSRRRPRSSSRFAELLTLPVATTLNGKSAFPEDHALALGIGGFGRASYGSLPATDAGGERRRDPHHRLRLQAARDHRAAERSAPSTSRSTSMPTEINRDHLADVAILGDAKVVLGQLVAAAKRAAGARGSPRSNAAREEIKALKADAGPRCASRCSIPRIRRSIRSA